MRVCIAYRKVLRVRKVFARIEKIGYKMKPELLSALKFFRLSRNFPDCPESFQTVWKVSGLSGKFPDSLANFQTVWKILTHSIVRASFYSQFFLYAQKLSGRAKTFRLAMHTRIPGLWDSGWGLLFKVRKHLMWSGSGQSGQTCPNFIRGDPVAGEAGRKKY